MPRYPTVALVRVRDGFEARIIAARLGAEGIVTSLRGGGWDSPYPMGEVEVLVAPDDLDDARALLLVDEIESAFDGDGDGEEPMGRRPRLPVWLAVAVAAALVLADIALVAFRP